MLNTIFQLHAIIKTFKKNPFKNKKFKIIPLKNYTSSLKFLNVIN